jgi:hypothetical protein
VKAANRDLIRGLCPDVHPGGVISLQYAEDTILFVANDLELATNLKNTLTCFEQVLGMRINFGKSELIPINMDLDEAKGFVDMFNCAVGTFLIKYLGIPLHYDKLRRENIEPLIDKILKIKSMLERKTSLLWW